MRWTVLSLIVVAGLAAMLVSGYYLLADWARLREAQAAFTHAVRARADLRAITVAYDYQAIHRLNCFAEGMGVLLGAILAAIGIHGLCAPSPVEGRTLREQ